MENEYYFPCPVCKKILKVEITKNQKPYLTCNDCGVQLFVRGKQGITKLSKLIGKIKLKGDSKDLINTVDLFNSLKEKLEEIRGKQPLVGHDLDLELQEKMILKQLERLRKNLQEEEKGQK